MRNDLREINRTMQENNKDKKMEYEIKKMLAIFFRSKLSGMEEEFGEHIVYEMKIDKIKLELLENRDEIIDNEIVPILKEHFGYKCLEELLDMVDEFYLSEYKKQTKYYDELNKLKKQNNLDQLENELYKIFKWSFNSSNLDARNKINYIRNIKYKNEIKQGLKEKDYDLTNFEKAYEKAFMRFKKDYINYDDFEEKKEEKGNDIGFGWRLYATTKIIEGLFKL